MPRFELQRKSGGRFHWTASVGLHVLVIILGITIVWTAPIRRTKPAEPEVTEWLVLPPVTTNPGTRRPARTPARVAGITDQPARSQPVQVPLRTPATLGPVGRTEGPIVLGPQVGDGRLWVEARPALPAEVAERLYGDTTARDSVVVQRLAAMLDTLNRQIDEDQRAHRLPKWSTQIAGLPFGIDQQFITIAGVKIPTMALALLGNLLPQGNYEEALRQRELSAMREDLMRAAARTETFRDFQHYVKELRARKQAERDAERRRPNPPADTTRVIP